MKLKIVSDGTSSGTSIVNAETGEKIEGITKIGWKITACSTAEAIIVLDRIPVDITGEWKEN